MTNAAAKHSVLLIDDEIINLRVLSDALKDEYAVIFATSGEEGCRRAIEAKPDIILLDVMMPDMDGYAVCEKLKSDPRTLAIPVVFVTALDSPMQEIKGLDTGAIDYVTKPINTDIVKARLRNHLKYKDVILAANQADMSLDVRLERLNERQKVIFHWVREGKTNWEIARIVGCSEENVKYHMKNILRLLGSFNRTQAAAGRTRPAREPE